MHYQIQIKRLLNITIEEKASDLHISVGHKPILRITRKLVRLEKEKIIVPKNSEGMAFALMNERQKEKFLREKEIDFAYDLNSIARFRVNVFFQMGSISIAFRLIPSEIKTIEELNLPSVLHKFSKATQGFVLITGASSQGKSTTLACLINEINNNREEHIITIENPIEYVFKDNKFHTLPVVDDDNRLAGKITLDEIVSVFQPQSAEISQLLKTIPFLDTIPEVEIDIEYITPEMGILVVADEIMTKHQLR